MGGTVLHTTAVVGDREVLASLRNPVQGQVHSAFRSVINVSTEQPELLCLTSASVPRGPRSLQLGLDRMDHYGIASGDRVVGDGHTLRVGESLVIILAATPAWEDPPTCGTPDLERVEQLDALMGTPHSLLGATAFEKAVALRVRAGIASLRGGVLAGDDEATHRAAFSLAGLGIGLTPTGDDVLTGAGFVAARLGGRLDVLHRAVADVVEAGPTNDLSLTALRCALRGRAVQPLEELYSWLCGASTDDPDHLVADVKAIGHTSGADLALGLLTAVRLHQESRDC
ncbi:oxamate carbamoyltransferase subunit AllH family protein [Tessaracoccus antarcticus]|nr:DUF2877 domain-containing protein [Tessaracoccus antarcticus]